MTRVLPPTNFHSSPLIRHLAELDLLEEAEPGGDFADELGRWVHFTDAIALASVHESGLAKLAVPSPAQREATGARLAADFEKAKTFLVNSITRSCAPNGRTHIKLPLVLQNEVTYLPYRQFYEAHQRDMELSVEPLRVNLRDALAKASPRLRKLAELDVVMDRILRPREAQLLARVPVLLQKRFAALYAAHLEYITANGQTDSAAAWTQPGGWLTSFCQTLQTLLLAEAELRLQPSAGLLEAFNQQKNHE